MTRRVSITLTDEDYASVKELARITQWPMAEMLSILLMQEVENQFEAMDDHDAGLTLAQLPVAGNA